MTTSFSITKQITINASTGRVWEALTTPEIVKQYMFGTEVVSTWQKGGPLVYKGQWDGQPFEDRGTILEIMPQKLLKATYFSAASGLEDKPENHNLVTYEIIPEEGGLTVLSITQDNNPSQSAADYAGENWEMTLNQIKYLLEKS